MPMSFSPSTTLSDGTSPNVKLPETKSPNRLRFDSGNTRLPQAIWGRTNSMPATGASHIPATSLMPNWPDTRGVLFDMGDVLFDATAWRRWLLGLLGRLGMHAQYRSLFHIWDVDYLDAVHRGECSYQHAFRAFLRSLGLSRGQIDEVCAASQARKREVETTIKPLPGVRSTLTELCRQGYVLGVLSDSESSANDIKRRLETIGLGGRFSTVVSSRDLARTKPDPVTYHTALEQMNLAAAETIFVGHDCDELSGATRVGMRTVAFNFDRDVAADKAIQRFDELRGVVGNWGRRHAAN